MDEKKFFSLLGQLNEFSKKNKGTAIINRAGRIPFLDRETSDMFLDSSATITNNFHFSERREYINLAKDFLADQITAEDFSFAFMSTYEGIDQEVVQMKEDESLELTNFFKNYIKTLNDLLFTIKKQAVRLLINLFNLSRSF